MLTPTMPPPTMTTRAWDFITRLHLPCDSSPTQWGRLGGGRGAPRWQSARNPDRSKFPHSRIAKCANEAAAKRHRAFDHAGYRGRVAVHLPRSRVWPVDTRSRRRRVEWGAAGGNANRQAVDCAEFATTAVRLSSADAATGALCRDRVSLHMALSCGATPSQPPPLRGGGECIILHSSPAFKPATASVGNPPGISDGAGGGGRGRA